MFNFKDEDLDEARRIVSNLDLPSEFGTDGDLDMSDLEMQLEDVIDGDYFVSCGISKAVIIVDYLPFVIKIPFNGRWETDWSDDSEDGKYFVEFDQANASSCFDYCEDELNKTHLIQDNGFGCFVPNMMYLSTVCGFNTYVQEKVIPKNESKDKNPSAGSLEKAKEEDYWDLVWAATAIDLYGFNFFHNFMDWAYSNCRDTMLDLHYGNYGYDMSGRPVILDVSGFRD